MDSQHRGPEDSGEFGVTGERGGAGRETVTPSGGPAGIAHAAPAGVVVPPHGTATPVPEPNARGASRVTQIVAGDHLVTVNPVDGCEVTGAPRERVPEVRRRTAAERTEHARAARPVPVIGAPAVNLPLLERGEESDRVVRLLARGRSVRVTGPSGSGRSALLNAVADRCGALAPDGVIRLSGHRRTPADLAHELYTAVHRTDGYRPDAGRLAAGLAPVGAVVVLDDVEFGGAALDELLASAGDCAFLVAATPRVPAPSADAQIEEIFLAGLSKTACVRLLGRAAERELTAEETSWAGDLWFASEGLPLRFVQAGALLRQRSAGLSKAVTASLSFDAPKDAGPALPSLAESAAPARLLADRLSGNGREALRVALALGGECVSSSHLPALTGVEQADGALAELISCGLATPVAGHHRLAAGVLEQLAGTEETAGYALRAADHYVWWAAHPSVPAARVAAEADAVLAAATACRHSGEHAAAVRLARAAAPEFAAALRWGAWERALRVGLEAARLAGLVGEEAYFHHELGVLALCGGKLDRARTELEASVGMRGALGDRQGGLVGRRALALVSDRSALLAAPVDPSAPATTRPLPAVRPGSAVAATASTATAPARAVRRPAHALPPGAEPAPPVVNPAASRHRHRGRRAAVQTRRNLAAAGAGAVIAAVLGTVVTIGAMTAKGNAGAGGRTGDAVAQNDDPATTQGGVPARAADTSQPSSAPGASTPASPPASASAPSGAPSASGGPGTPTAGTTPHPGTSGSPSHGAGTGGTGSGSPSTGPTDPQSPSGSPDPSDSGDPSGSPSGSPDPTDSGAPSQTPDPGGSATPPPSSTGSASVTPTDTPTDAQSPAAG